MEWLVIIGLGVWVWLQSQRIQTLTHKLAELERRLGAPTEAAFAASAPLPEEAEAEAAPELEPLVLDQPLPPEDEPLVLNTPLPLDDREPLLLDTPVPEASNDDALEAPPPPVPPARPHILMPGAKAMPVRERSRRLEQWLAENGLAWLGGAAFAAGAVYLVTVAAQQSWFTPLVQVSCAVLLGLVLIGVSEWARAANLARPPGHPLVAALLAGAGVMTFYVTAWAAHSVYGFTGEIASLALLTLCALMLIALSFLHGEAFGVLAIAAALIAPALTGANAWPFGGVVLFVCGVSAAGFALAAFRRWPWVAAAAMAGLYFWFASALAENQLRRALALLSFAALGGVAIAFRQAKTDAPEDGYFTWRSAHAYLPAIAISVSSVLLVWIWLATAPSTIGSIAGPAWVGAMFVALSAAAVRARVAAPPTFTVAVAGLVLGFIVYLQARFHFGPLGADLYPFVLFCAFAVAASALGAHPHHSARTLVAASGAVGAALLTILAAFSRDDWHSVQAWAPLFAGAAVLFGAAWQSARTAADPHNDHAVTLWSGAAAALVLLGIESAIPAEARSAAHAGAALLFAGGVVWRGWNGLRFAAITAAAVAIANALSPALIGAVMTGAIPLWGALTVLAASAALLFGAGFFTQRAGHGATGEALSSAGVIAILIGAYLALSWIATGGTPTPRLDVLTEEALRALILLAGGHIVMARPGQELGRIGRWRGHVLFGVGLLYVLLSPGLTVNPWWGSMPVEVRGPPIVNALLLAFAAPAALAFAAAYRLYGRARTAARIYAAGGGLFALMWAALEIRHLFHAPLLNVPQVGVFEGACYALLFLAAALAIAIVARQRMASDAERPFTQDLARITQSSAVTAVAAAGLIMLALRHPWWGGQIAADSDALSTGLAVLAQLVATGLALALGRALSVSRPVEPSRFAAAAGAMLFAWSFGHSAIRWLYHHGAMDDSAALIGLEGVAHALWPLAFVLLATEAIARAPGRDTIRQYAYDLQALCAAAAWPALVFAGVGVWLLFNPWWGLVQSQPASPFSTTLAPAAPILAAWLSRTAPRIPQIRADEWFAHAAKIASLAHLFVAATLVVRWLYHSDAMASADVAPAEMWTYSAIWALFGAAVFGLGLRRDDALLRWAGLIILVAVAGKVALLDTARLGGFMRAASVLGLAAVLVGVSWVARTQRPKPGPGDLLTIKPSARRGRRYGRRQRSS